MSCLVHFITLLLALLSSTTTAVFHRHRRILLHQPFFPVDYPASPPSLTTPPPLSSPQPQPKYPFSSFSPNTPLTENPFFPLFSPPPPDVTVATFPANISSLILPRSSSHSPPYSISGKLIAVIILVSIISLAFITTLITFLLRHPLKEEKNPTDSLRLVPPNATPSDGNKQHSHPPTPVAAGEVESPELRPTAVNYYQRLGSPELQPLPPLPRQHFPNNEVGSSEDDEYFSPRGSSPHAASFYDQVPLQTFPYSNSNSPHAAEIPLQAQNTFPYSNSISPSQSLSNSPSLECTRSLTSKSPDSLLNFLAPPRFVPRFQDNHNSPSLVSDSSARISESSPSNVVSFGSYVSLKWPPPPPPLPRFWEVVENGGPPVLVPPSRPLLVNGISESSEDVERRNVEESIKPKLKPLHWDKVRATSDRAMVWDHLKSCSFQLNEEMIEALFTVNSSNLDSKVGVTRPVKPVLNQENRVLDPKKSHNIAILLRALNITIEEVCEALLEGNADTMGTELLESLLKMGPTKEEERKLMEFKDESHVKLGPAEIFLKAVLGIPFAFNRVDAMLYIANFDSEVEYLKRSFETLKIACDELRNSRMFLKLLEAVLKTGNRMNVGTNRGDACAFKLDTLLKLVDVKAADGKTTLLHFVVQEIIRAEGSRLSGADQNPNVEKNPQSTLQDEVEFRKIGLQVVSRLSGELTNVKKAAAMDFDIVSNEVAKLVTGISKITNVVKLNEELVLTESSRKFSESMNGFLKKAEEEIMNIQAQEGVALSMVKELTEYFHGDSVKEEGRPLRIFMVVRDFLSILDNVCKDIGKMTERTRVSSGRQFPLPINAGGLPQFFAR